jgi:hypothetical protein
MELISIVASLGGLFLAGANVAIFCVVKFNDLAHLQKSQEEIKNTLSTMDKKLDNNAERLAKLEGKCKANHG